jgi:hypothetical protein
VVKRRSESEGIQSLYCFFAVLFGVGPNPQSFFQVELFHLGRHRRAVTESFYISNKAIKLAEEFGDMSRQFRPKEAEFGIAYRGQDKNSAK